MLQTLKQDARFRTSGTSLYILFWPLSLNQQVREVSKNSPNVLTDSWPEHKTPAHSKNNRKWEMLKLRAVCLHWFLIRKEYKPWFYKHVICIPALLYTSKEIHSLVLTFEILKYILCYNNSDLIFSVTQNRRVDDPSQWGNSLSASPSCSAWHTKTHIQVSVSLGLTAQGWPAPWTLLLYRPCSRAQRQRLILTVFLSPGKWVELWKSSSFISQKLSPSFTLQNLTCIISL